MWLDGWEQLIISHHSAKFGDHKQCGSGDKMFLVVGEQDFTCSCLNPPIHRYIKYVIWHVNKSDPGNTHLKQQ